MYGCVAILCLIYAVLFILLFGHLVDPGRIAGAAVPDLGDYSVAGLRPLFASDGGIVIGWTHYLAFDLFVGLWIAKDADHKGFSRAGPGAVPVRDADGGADRPARMAGDARSARAARGKGRVTERASTNSQAATIAAARPPRRAMSRRSSRCSSNGFRRREPCSKWRAGRASMPSPSRAIFRT
jgi:hypothetical protein